MVIDDSDFRAKVIGLLSERLVKWENRRIAVNSENKNLAINMAKEIEYLLDEVKNIS